MKIFQFRLRHKRDADAFDIECISASYEQAEFHVRKRYSDQYEIEYEGYEEDMEGKIY
jgi:hypothetical protein